MQVGDLVVVTLDAYARYVREGSVLYVNEVWGHGVVAGTKRDLPAHHNSGKDFNLFFYNHQVRLASLEERNRA